MSIQKTQSLLQVSFGKILNKMKVKITRIDKSLPLPEYHTKGSVGFDFYARITTKVKPKQFASIPTNLIIATPKGYMLMVANRSSTGVKKGLMMLNGVGVGDQDFCGPTDEYHMALYNFTNKTITVERGERVAQGIFVSVGIADWVETKPRKAKSRGGYGSTGTHIKK